MGLNKLNTMTNTIPAYTRKWQEEWPLGRPRNYADFPRTLAQRRDFLAYRLELFRAMFGPDSWEAKFAEADLHIAA